MKGCLQHQYCIGRNSRLLQLRVCVNACGRATLFIQLAWMALQISTGGA